jgi:guanylate kinase
VRRLLPGVVGVFLVAESEAQLVARLVSRKTEPLDKMATRVQTARRVSVWCGGSWCVARHQARDHSRPAHTHTHTHTAHTTPHHTPLHARYEHRQECAQLADFDYVVTNREGQLEGCVDALCAIIDAERVRGRRQHQEAGADGGGGGGSAQR